MKITIDSEFRKLIPPLSPDEFRGLEADILRDGCLNPLVVWRVNGDRILLDGHNRYRICEAHGKHYDVTELKIERRDQAKLWIEEQAVNKRNLPDDPRVMIIESIRERRAAIAKKQRAAKARAAGGKATPEQIKRRAFRSEEASSPKRSQRTRTAVAQEYKTSEWKLRMAQEIKAVSPKLVAKVRAGTLTLAEAYRTMKREALVQRLESVEAIKAKRLSGRFDVLVIDPPWPIEKIERDKRPRQVYLPDFPTMTVEEIEKVTYKAVDRHAEGDAHIFLWTTQKFLPDALNLVKSCRLRYVCLFVWHKPGGFQPFGLPQYNCEFVLYARKGAPKFIQTKKFNTCFWGARLKHSEKPEEFYDMLRRVTAGHRVDMFSRRVIEGFEGWGKEAKQRFE